MIHGKWYKGNGDLSVLERPLTQEDTYSWHLVIYEGESKKGMLSLCPYEDSFILTGMRSEDEGTTELMLRMVGAKLCDFGKEKLYAGAIGFDMGKFGFGEYKSGVLLAEKLILPKHCKG